VGADGRGLRKVFDRGTDPDWSPDGRQIAFAIRDLGHVFILDLPSGDVRQLTKPSEDPPSPGVCDGPFADPQWSPDGVELALGTFASACNAHYTGSVVAIKPDGTGQRVLAYADSCTDAVAFSGVWAPDGSRLAVAHDPGACGRFGRIEIISRDGAVLRKIRSQFAPLDWQPLCTQRGTARADAVRARAESDLACGLAGNDWITGGAGGDRLFGEEGDDRVFAHDGEFDVVGCGPGRDAVVADGADLVGVDCERVTRR
jgi:hypothetical protein